MKVLIIQLKLQKSKTVKIPHQKNLLINNKHESENLNNVKNN